MTTTKTRKGGRPPGRPPGSQTQARPVVDTVATACPKCGSTERTPYTNTRECEHAGVDKTTGLPFTHIVWRHTCCANPACRQVRVDRTFENRVR